MIRVPLEFHGASDEKVYVDIETYGDYREHVLVTFQGEVKDEAPTERVLLPEEARAIAAALVHYAEQADA